MRPRKLTAEAIVDAALARIDAVGLEAVSMRGIGTELGASAMAIYRYFDSKEALFDAVQARIVAEIPPLSSSGDWRVAIERLARSFRAVLRAHPRAIPLFSRPAATYDTFERLEEAVGILERAGFSAEDALNAFQVTLAFIVGHALWQYTPDGERPVDDEFAFGIQTLIAGLEQRLSAS